MNLIENIGKEQLSFGDSEFIRENFLIEDLIIEDEILMHYTPYDRIIIGGAMPINKNLVLQSYDKLLKSSYFCERREIGIINIGDEGMIVADGVKYTLAQYGCLYLGKGTQQIEFIQASAGIKPMYYFVSTPAHAQHTNVYMPKEQAIPMTIGSKESANERTVYKYIHLEGIQSCQLVMGLTRLHPGNIWNTMPPHVHDRRSEVYFYFELPDNQVVFHFLGEPTEIKTLITRNHQATLSPPWSIHSGAGTSAYSFIWAMGGENKDYTDMDVLSLNEI
nr:5-dehydro-4-deoxy-D-glucuronate isomerase [Saprospiraceae bacterium]